MLCRLRSIGYIVIIYKFKNLTNFSLKPIIKFNNKIYDISKNVFLKRKIKFKKIDIDE